MSKTKAVNGCPISRVFGWVLLEPAIEPQMKASKPQAFTLYKKALFMVEFEEDSAAKSLLHCFLNVYHVLFIMFSWFLEFILVQTKLWTPARAFVQGLRGAQRWRKCREPCTARARRCSRRARAVHFGFTIVRYHESIFRREVLGSHKWSHFDMSLHIFGML